MQRKQTIRKKILPLNEMLLCQIMKELGLKHYREKKYTFELKHLLYPILTKYCIV